MYKGAHKLGQARADRIWLKEMPALEEQLTPEQRRDVLRSCVQRLEQMIKEAPDEESRRDLGRQKFVFQTQIQHLNKVLGAYPKRDVGQFMLDILRRQLSPVVWQRAHAEAQELFEKHEAERTAKLADIQ